MESGPSTLEPSIWKRRSSKIEFLNSQASADFSNSQTSQSQASTSQLQDSAIPPSLWDLFQERGFKTFEQAQSFISPSLKNLRSPFLLRDMDKAVERLIKAFKEQQKVLVYGDFDLDGTSGVALLKTGFENLGFKNITYYQPSRLTEGYGVHVHAIEKFKEENIDLVVTVDLGITDVKAVARAGELGLDVIVTDHHLPKEELPQALAIVNPNQKDCSSGLGHLCGAGVGFFLILGLRQKMKEQGLVEKDFDPKSLLDVFTIATLTDLVPLKEENRVLVKHGLVQLAQTKREGLKTLLKHLGLYGRPLTSGDVSIYFAPKLNALSRMEKGIRPLDLYLVEGEDKAQDLVVEVMKTNSLRIQLQKQAEGEAFDQVFSAESTKSVEDGFSFVSSKNFHKGVIGLVATKLANKFNIPSFVGSISDSGSIVGSSRVPHDGYSVLEALNFSKKALVRYGGHKAAAGFELKQDQQESFVYLLKEFFSQQHKIEASKKIYDTELELSDLDDYFMSWHQALEPFGKDFSHPVFLLKKVSIQSIYSLKGGHLKFQFDQKPGVSALWFSPPEQDWIAEIEKGFVVNILVKVQWNFFNGIKSLQLLIQDLRVC